VGESVAGGAGFDDGTGEGEPVDDRRAKPGVGEGLGPAGIASIAALNPSNRGEDLVGVRRGGGSADVNACRTVRRCTRCLTASSRIDSSSTRASRRIAANNSTLDPIASTTLPSAPTT
jgi:hypothetical protein